MHDKDYYLAVRLNYTNVSYETIWQRFHNVASKDDPVRCFRCFICRDGRTLSWDELKEHLEDKHTYAQVTG